jgi:hypothetical protein
MILISGIQVNTIIIIITTDQQHVGVRWPLVDGSASWPRLEFAYSFASELTQQAGDVAAREERRSRGGG